MAADNTCKVRLCSLLPYELLYDCHRQSLIFRIRYAEHHPLGIDTAEQLDKLEFDEYRPSPLGRVAERSEVGRGIKNCYVIWITTACTPLPSCLRHATFPIGEGFGCGVKQLDKLEFD